MKIIKELDKLNKNKQHLITCNLESCEYNIEVSNTGVNNTKVSMSVVDSKFKNPFGWSGDRDILIEPNNCYTFTGVACAKGQKVIIESTMKDVYVTVYAPDQ